MRLKNILLTILGDLKMLVTQFTDTKFCPNCKVRMTVINKDWNSAIITRECPCCKSTLMTPYGDDDIDLGSID